MKEKAKKNIKDFLKDIIALAFIAAIIFGGYKLYENYKSNNASNDDSYKIVTERSPKNNGVYSLTKLDESGNNTWNGLMLYVKNDKIVSCARYEYVSSDEIVNKIPNDIKKTLNDSNLDEMDFLMTISKYIPKGGQKPLFNTGFIVDGHGVGDRDKKYDFMKYPINKGFLKCKGIFVAKDKVDFDRVTDIKTDYDFMKDCDIVSGYDEKNQEVWLSKLLSNEKSEYHEGYKLIHYSSANDLDKNCKLADYFTIDALNEEFNAGLR